MRLADAGWAEQEDVGLEVLYGPDVRRVRVEAKPSLLLPSASKAVEAPRLEALSVGLNFLNVET